MDVLRAILYIVAVTLLVVAALWRPNPAPRVGLVCLAGACALLAFSLPVITGLGGG